MLLILNMQVQEASLMTQGERSGLSQADILAYLGVESAPPSLEFLDVLIDAYTWVVPWESASRIANRAIIERTADCPRFADRFWQDAIRAGSGGTCFESNYAFFQLLRSLGFEGYLTINDMNDNRGCHTACVIMLDEQPYLVDVGIPLYVAIPLDSARTTQRDSHFHTYTCTPQSGSVFEITRDRHPTAYIYTMMNIPVKDADYRRATTDDYGEDGLFLDRVVINKVIDGVQWRFSSDGPPYHLESFKDGDKTYYLLGSDLPNVAEKVAHQFELDEDTVFAALTAVTQTT
jgi:hypothetical protein